MKRSFVTYGLLAALVASLGLAGCNRNKDASPSDDTPKAPAAEEADRASTAPAADSTTSSADNSNASSDSSTSNGNTVANDAKATAGTVGNSIDNATLTAKVKAALAKDAGLKTLKLNVDSNDGVVTITGTVATTAMHDLIDQVAKGVTGVTGVRNNVVVKGTS